jgi:hypothetical protein
MRPIVVKIQIVSFVLHFFLQQQPFFCVESCIFMVNPLSLALANSIFARFRDDMKKEGTSSVLCEL